MEKENYNHASSNVLGVGQITDVPNTDNFLKRQSPSPLFIVIIVCNILNTMPHAVMLNCACVLGAPSVLFSQATLTKICPKTTLKGHRIVYYTTVSGFLFCAFTNGTVFGRTKKCYFKGTSVFQLSIRVFYSKTVTQYLNTIAIYAALN
jgi:hypothetical protein